MKKSDIKKILIILITIVVIYIIWFSSIFNVEYQKEYKSKYDSQLDNISLSYGKRDVSEYFQKLIFLSFYEHVIKALRGSEIDLDDNKPINSILKILDEDKGKVALEHLKILKDVIKNYTHKNNLKTIFIFPFSSVKYMYKIDVQSLQVYFLSSTNFKNLNENNKFIRFDFNKRIVFFNKKELISGYSSEIEEVIKLTDNGNIFINNNFEKQTSIILNSAKFIVTILYFLALILFLISEKRMRMISKYEKNKDEYNSDIHYSQHDVKTNSTIILNRLNTIYRTTSDYFNEKTNLNFLDTYILELSISHANDYAKQGSFDEYSFKHHFEDEKILTWYKEDTPLTKEISTKVVITNVNIDNMIENVVKDKYKKFYKDELSSAVFRLINNSIKHKRRNSLVNLNIGLTDDLTIKIDIINELEVDVVNDDIIKNIKNSYDSEGKHNLSMVRAILSKYNMKLDIVITDNVLKLTID